MLKDIAGIQSETEEVHIVIVNNAYSADLVNSISDQVRIHYIARPEGSRNPWFFVKLNLLLLKVKPDVIHIHTHSLYKFVKLNVPMVYTAHSCLVSSKDVQHYPVVYCISKAVEHYCKNLGAKNTVVVHNGIALDSITPRNNQQGSYACNNIVCVGRLSKEKGQKVLIDACSHLVSNNQGYENLHIDFIGDGPERITLEEYVKVKHLEQYITFRGIQSREYIYSNLCKYDLYVMPSINEGFGLTVAEAMAAKIPVLTCNLDGPMEVIDFGKYGKSFIAGDSKDLAYKLKEIIENNVSEEALESAYDYVRANFDVRNTAFTYIKEYKKIIG